MLLAIPVVFLALCLGSTQDAVESTEEHIIGLEEFLTELDPNTSDIILELLEAQSLSTSRSNRMMRRIMRKLPASTLDKLFQIYKQTHES